MLDGTAFFHSAMVVADLDRSMAELAGTLGVRWASPMVFDTGLWVEDGTTRWAMRVAYSTQGAQLFELIEARRIEGVSTFYDVAPGTTGHLHHVGAWSDSFTGDTADLVGGGARLVASSLGEDGMPQGLGFYRLATGLTVEVIDTGGRPSFETWLAGGPPPM